MKPIRYILGLFMAALVLTIAINPTTASAQVQNAPADAYVQGGVFFQQAGNPAVYLHTGDGYMAPYVVMTAQEQDALNHHLIVTNQPVPIGLVAARFLGYGGFWTVQAGGNGGTPPPSKEK